MPLSVVKRLNLGELTPTAMNLQAIDRTMAQLKEININILIKNRISNLGIFL